MFSATKNLLVGAAPPLPDSNSGIAFGQTSASSNITIVGSSVTVLAFVSQHTGSPTYSTPTLAGVNMTLHGTIGPSRVYYLTGVSSGTKALAVGGAGLDYVGIWGIAHTGVNNIGALQSNTASASSGTAMSSGSLTCPPNGILLHAFALWSGNNFSTSMSSLAGGSAIGTGYGAHSAGLSMSARRSAGAGATFTATAGGNPSNYTSAAVLLT